MEDHYYGRDLPAIAVDGAQLKKCATPRARAPGNQMGNPQCTLYRQEGALVDT